MAKPIFRAGAACRNTAQRDESAVFEVSTRRGKQFNTLIYDEIDPLTGASATPSS